MVWGAIGLGCKSDLIFIDGTLNSQGHIDYLKDNSIFEEMRCPLRIAIFISVRRCFA
jgi:hypothetical protein